MNDQPLSPTPATTWLETPKPDEEVVIEWGTALLSRLQRAAARRGPTRRALHAKGLVAARGTFEVSGQTPTYARHGVFVEPRSFDARVRFSNASNLVRADSAPDVRGIGVQLLGVTGARALGPADVGTTQDFLAIDRSSIPFRSIAEFVLLQRVAVTPLRGLVGAIAKLGLRRTFALVHALTRPVPPLGSLALHTFSSNAPIRLGPYAMHFAFVPLDASIEPVTVAKASDTLGPELKERLRAGSVGWAFEARMFVEETTTPIEDPSVLWPGPSIRLGTLTLPMQNVDDVGEETERAAFDPWHALELHRPLGTLMRARKAAYFASVQARSPRA